MIERTVCAIEKFHDTTIDVEVGQLITITASGTWYDWGIPSGPEGFTRLRLRPLGWAKRHVNSRWFTLTAVIGKRKGPFHAIGRQASFVAERSGRLYLFANDAWIAYGNNSGAVTAVITVENKD